MENIFESFSEFLSKESINEGGDFDPIKIKSISIVEITQKILDELGDNEFKKYLQSELDSSNKINAGRSEDELKKYPSLKNVPKGSHLTAGDIKQLKAMFEQGFRDAKVGRKNWKIIETDKPDHYIIIEPRSDNTIGRSLIKISH